MADPGGAGPAGGVPTRVFGCSPPEVAEVARLLRAGELVGLPTETVYGLGANALDEAACRRVFALKGRPLIDPLIVHVTGAAAAAEVARWTGAAGALAEAFWPGPLTLVLEKRPALSDLVTGGRPSVAVRSPRHPATRQVLAAAAVPVAAPSANPFGYVSPTRAGHVLESLGGRLPYLLDGGPCEIGLESTILDLRPGYPPAILRPGAVPAEALAAVLGEAPAPAERSAPGGRGGLTAPGTLGRHYGPAARIALFPPGGEPPATVAGEAAPDAVVYFARPPAEPPDRRGPAPVRFWLTEDGDPAAAAHDLFHLLRELDRRGLRWVAVEQAPPGGLGDAINDRLGRAALPAG